MYGVSHLDRRISDVLGIIGLTNRKRDLVRTFSRGMQQRLSIGRAIMHDPELILFDEPHTGLDQDACIMLDSILRDVAARGHTIVMTSHDLARVAELASRFDVLSRGVIVASANKDEVTPDNLLAYYRRSLQVL
jgi:heme exporter protein A